MDMVSIKAESENAVENILTKRGKKKKVKDKLTKVVNQNLTKRQMLKDAKKKQRKLKNLEYHKETNHIDSLQDGIKGYFKTHFPSKLPKSSQISKYWPQRYELFSKFDEGILLDEESWYSVTPERIAKHIAEKCKCGVVVDGFCGAGGNAIQFAKTCSKVIAVDICKEKIAIARHNARVYGVEDKIEFIVGDFFEVVPNLQADVVFLAPPWGGPEYLKQKVFDLKVLGGSMNGFSVFSVAKKVTNNISLFVPRNSDMNQLAFLAGEGGRVQVEKNLVNKKTKTITAYYGDLVSLRNLLLPQTKPQLYYIPKCS